MTSLEHRYRRVLALLPAYYRQDWEDDMVATFLESTLPDDPDDAAFTAEYGWPPWSEMVSIAALAIRLRLGGAAGPPRYRAWGAALRRLALVGLLTHAAFSLVGLAATAWWPQPVEFYAADAARPWWLVVSTITSILWLAAYLALLGGYWRAAQLLAITALLPSLPWPGSGTGGYGLLSMTSWLLYAAVPVLATAAFDRDSPPPRWRPWLLALPVGVVAITTPLILFQLLDGHVLIDDSNLYCMLLWLAALAYLAAPRLGWGGRSASWSLTLALLALQVLGLRVVNLVELLRDDSPNNATHTLISLAAPATVVTALIAVVLLAVANRALQALPVAPA